jgi:hypothetical protein
MNTEAFDNTKSDVDNTKSPTNGMCGFEYNPPNIAGKKRDRTGVDLMNCNDRNVLFGDSCKLTQVYEWNNDAYHARVVKLPGSHSTVQNIASHSWILTCVT